MERLGLVEIVCHFLRASVVVEPSSQIDQEDFVESLGLAVRS